MNPFKGAKILVVDDEEVVRFTLQSFLNHLGHPVEVAEEGISGLKAVENGDYGAVFVDIRMPGMDGIHLLHEARKIRPHLPVIMISGHGSDETQREAMEAGAFGFLNKPFRFDEIRTLLNKIENA